MENTLVAGVDLGATHVRVGLFDAAGRRLVTRLAKLDQNRGPCTGVNAVIAEIEALLEEQGHPALSAVGAGVTGPVDPVRGLVINPFAEPDWSMAPFTQPLEDHFGVPVVVENDADAAALGEWWQGVGQGSSRLLAVTLGTGIGTAFLLDGEIYRGLDGSHPESGHHTIDPRGPQCYCGANGCWESLAGGQALLEMIRLDAEADPAWMRRLGFERPEDVTVAAVAQAAREHDRRASVIMAREGYYLSLGIVNLITFFVPEVLVLSGGLLQSYDLFEPHILKRAATQNLMVPAGRVKILPAALGYYAGVTGAACAALNALKIKPSLDRGAIT